VRADASLIATAPLLASLDHIAKHGSRERRAETLKRLTNLFLVGADDFTADQIQLFDEVFNRLIIKIEARARFELSVSLAGLDNAPREVVRQLANDGNASIARPVLERSRCLEDADLLDVAKSKSQQHLLAISNRSQIAEPITDVLVRRGDREVVRSVAANSGARLSPDGYSTLVRKAEKDGILAETVGLRADLPEPLLRLLFTQAAHVVQKRLLAAATQESRAKILHVLAAISNDYGIDAPSHGGVSAASATPLVRSENKLDEMLVAKLASEGNLAETVLGLSKLCNVPFESMHRIMGNKGGDPALVVCKALGFGWQTARAIVLLQTRGLGISAHSLDIKSRNFHKLSVPGCQDVMRLWSTVHDADQPSRLTG
jgi:uncharacterized protein (DUF2336 family)